MAMYITINCTKYTCKMSVRSYIEINMVSYFIFLLVQISVHLA